MPGRKAAFIKLSPEQEKILIELKSDTTHSMMHFKRRAEIILLAATEETNASIQNMTGLAKNSILIWRSRYAAANIELATVEAETPNKLRDAIIAILSDKKRPGAPATFTEEQVASIIALSRTDPAELSLPFSHWTQFQLCNEAIDRDIVTSISATQISRFLKREGMKAASDERLSES